MKVIDVQICENQLFGEGGFARLRRLKLRNVRQDGSISPPYTLDLVERPGRADAVSVIAYQRQPAAGQILVLLRQGIRPIAKLGRAGQPTREGINPKLEHLEVVSGLLEIGDEGEEGLARRAAAELMEETGLHVDPAQVRPLGPPVYLSIGIMSERIYFCHVEADLNKLTDAKGDGSFMEEGGRGVIYQLSMALDLCQQGEIQDAKTEVALRRLQALDL